jgi:hypothetical protein
MEIKSEKRIFIPKSILWKGARAVAHKFLFYSFAGTKLRDKIYIYASQVGSRTEDGG